jgi:hypothetical protein
VKKAPTQTIEVENDETHLTNNPAYRGGGVNNTKHVNRTTPATPGLITNDTIDKIELIKAPRKPPTAGPCSSVTTNAKSPNSGRSSTKAKNKNCQEFEAVRPNSPQTPNAAQYNPKELQINSTKNTRKVTKPKNQDIEVENDETHRTHDPKVREGGVNDSTVPTNRAPFGVITHNFDKLGVRTVPSKAPAAKPAKRKVKKPRN